MVFVLVLFGLVIGVYLLLTVSLLFVGLYGVFGAVIYGPLLLVSYIQRVFNGEGVSKKSYDVHKVREVSNRRLTDSKSHNRVSGKGTPYEVEAQGITVIPPNASSLSNYPDMV